MCCWRLNTDFLYFAIIKNINNKFNSELITENFIKTLFWIQIKYIT